MILVQHGTGTPNYGKLNKQTIEDIRLHKLDLKMAEKEVFGRLLERTEWEVMKIEEKDLNSLRMLDVVKKRMQKRVVETGKF